MCGIAGILHLDGRPVVKSQLDLLTDAVSHRGPDGRGVWINAIGNLGFGHRRLSILDVSDNGHQPMSYDNGRFWITLNGEIYNFIEIRNELQEIGFAFQSESDTEVVLAAYKMWGKKMLDRFNGMWAFAIYDAEKNNLFLSRDRFGVKPLYYYHVGNEFFFSSEVQAIHEILGRDQELNTTVIQEVVRGRYTSHGTKETYLKDVFALPGGYNLCVENNKIEITEWYSLKKVKVPRSFIEQAAAFKTLIEDACKLRMRSDVPVATCLSGGLDSSAITAMIATYKPDGNRFNHYSHKGFCAAFRDTPFDESEDAVKLAKKINSEIDVLNIEAPTVTELENAMKYCDGPMHALAFYPIWKLYRHIRESKIAVTLDGQGPDEMLGGYRPLREALEAAVELKKRAWFHDVYETYSNQGESSQFSSKKFAKDELEKFKRSRSEAFKRRVKNILLFRKENQVQQKAVGPFKLIRFADTSANAFDKSLFNQFFQNPLPSILQQYDRCSMANGVECRMPFMDYRIVEFVFSLPVESKVGGGYTKRILREATKEILPDETRLNKRKIGFNAPIVDWFRGELKEFMLENINAEDFQNSKYFDGKKLKNDFDDFLKSENPNWDVAWKFWPPVHLTWWLKNISSKQKV